MTKYFDFSGTIDGGTYFLRGLLGGVAFIVSYILIGGLIGAVSAPNQASLEAGIAIAFVLTYLPFIVFALSNRAKRINALFPDSKVVAWICSFIPLVSIIIGLYLLFGNSNIENHQG